MARRTHKKKQHRRRTRGGSWWNPMSWGKPAPLPGTPAEAAAAVKPVVPSPVAQASALGTAAPSTQDPVIGPDASVGSLPAAGGRRRRSRRKHHTRRR